MINLMDELKKNLDFMQNDFATIRIYWKFYDDKKMSQPHPEAGYPKQMKRAYFMYLSKNRSVIELDQGDVRKVLDYCTN